MYLAYFEREPFLKGVNAGKQEGRLEGRAERDLAIIHNMLALGFDLETIAKATQLTLNEVVRLSKLAS